MTVKQLREKLATMDDDLKVYVYSDLSEDGGECYSAGVPSDFPYCKGDPPDNLAERFVVLKG